jgi:hypothetical protein
MGLTATGIAPDFHWIPFSPSVTLRPQGPLMHHKDTIFFSNPTQMPSFYKKSGECLATSTTVLG